LVYTSIAAGLAAAFCWGTADYLSRSQSEKVGYYRTVIYSHVVTLVVILLLIPFISPNLVAPVAPVAVLAAAGALNLVAFIFLYRAFHTGVVSVVAPVAYTYPAVTAVLSVAILGTVISSERILAVAGIILGVILLSTRFSELSNSLRGTGTTRLTAGVRSAIGSSLTFGTVYIAIGYAAPVVSVVVPVMVLRAVGIAVGVSLAPILHQDIRPSRLTFSPTMVAMGVLETAGFLSFTYGISVGGGSLPIVAAISGMGGAVAAVYGLYFLKERLEPNQMLGALMSLLGVFTLLYLGG
jgi:drug/metabolite transporter (DMT)-like permease